jgi:hypothetical protein
LYQPGALEPNPALGDQFAVLRKIGAVEKAAVAGAAADSLTASVDIPHVLKSNTVAERVRRRPRWVFKVFISISFY